jgi:DNA-binding IclR family transcriptional regulator
LDGHARAGGKLLLAYARDDVREDYIRRHPLRPRTPTTICDARALEAEFSRIRDRAYAYDEQEFVLGVSCVAAPLIGKRGHIVASIAISAPTDRFNRLRRDFTNAALQVVKGIEDGRFDRTLSTEYEFGPARG